jgi:hypothetical protein
MPTLALGLVRPASRAATTTSSSPRSAACVPQPLARQNQGCAAARNEKQLEQVRQLLAYVVAWLCGGFTAALVTAVYLASSGKLDWQLVFLPVVAGSSAYLGVCRHEGVKWW